MMIAWHCMPAILDGYYTNAMLKVCANYTPVCSTIGSDLDWMCIPGNRFQSSLIMSALQFCKANQDHKMWACPWQVRYAKKADSSIIPISIHVVALVQWKCKQIDANANIPFQSTYNGPPEVNWLISHSIPLGFSHLQYRHNQWAFDAHSMSSVDRLYDSASGFDFT